jgi:hypothetical protein
VPCGVARTNCGVAVSCGAAVAGGALLGSGAAVVSSSRVSSHSRESRTRSNSLRRSRRGLLAERPSIHRIQKSENMAHLLHNERINDNASCSDCSYPREAKARRGSGASPAARFARVAQGRSSGETFEGRTAGRVRAFEQRSQPRSAQRNRIFSPCDFLRGRVRGGYFVGLLSRTRFELSRAWSKKINESAEDTSDPGEWVQ